MTDSNGRRAATTSGARPPSSSDSSSGAPGPGGSLAEALREAVRGSVRFDRGVRALFATDASNYRQVPLGVIAPVDSEDVREALRVCREAGAPVLSRGGGTSLAGQACNAAVVLDFSRHMNRILEVDPDRRLARVQPGVILDDLRLAANELGLTFGPDPATHAWCTLGGMIGNNSCGVHSLTAGRTEDNVEELVVVTYDGELLRVGATPPDQAEAIVRRGGRRGELYGRLRALRDRVGPLVRERYPDIPRRVSGYSLDALLPERGFHLARSLVGSEGTCTVTLEATLRLVEHPKARVLLLLAYPDVFVAADHVPAILEHAPSGLEGMDAALIEAMRRKRLMTEHLPLLPPGGGWLLAEFGGEDVGQAEERARNALRAVEGGPATSGRLVDDPADQRRLWAIRESALGASVFVPGLGSTWEGWEDAAVAPERLGSYLRGLQALFRRYGYRAVLYGHFGQGCVHNRVDFDLESVAGIRRFRAFLDEAADLVVAHGGSISGEHGDGQARGALLGRMYGPELVAAFREFKGIWDPDGGLNPGKLVEPYEPDENLRLGADFRPVDLDTHFRYPADGGSFARATLRCVGVGKCRRTEGGTMCPSYMVTREEKHTTRGRAHLLFEMVKGEVITDGWRSEEVKEALDLCLACKGCKAECPATVDVATYKAEFLSHYWRGRPRPRAAYALGLVHWWARAGSRAPGLVNALLRIPLLEGLAKRAASVAQERTLPRLAPETYRAWHGRRNAADRAFAGSPVRTDEKRPVRGTVLLWPDTFNDHFTPDIARDATEVLETAGYEVRIPRVPLCCGRPLYDWGMLDLARIQLRRILAALRTDIEAGTPLVGLEPSCVAVFRDELPALFPDDPLALRLSRQALHLSEFLDGPAADFPLPRTARPVVVHGHCHHRAVLDFAAELRVLSRMEVETHELDSGCCGMAGAFGFQERHVRVAQAVGERVLLPEVRRTPPTVPVLTDGFSCGEMIRQSTGRRPVHLAELIREGLEREGRLPARNRSAGRAGPTRIAAGPTGRGARAALLLAAGVAVAFGGLLLLRGLRR